MKSIIKRAWAVILMAATLSAAHAQTISNPAPASNTTYLGAVAGRGVVANMTANAGSPYQTMTRTGYVATETSFPRPVLGLNWYVPQATNVETPNGGTCTTTAALEYPAGTYTQYRFAGSATGAGNSGDVVVPDPITTSVPRGGNFWVRWWLSCTSGWTYRGNFPARPGDGFNSGTTTADLTMGGGAGPAGGLGNIGSLHVAPLAIIGQTSRRSFMGIGDSIMSGGGTDAASDYSGHQGLLARVVGGDYAYSNFGVSSTRANQFTAANAPRRIALAAYFSDVVNNYGVNDSLNGIAAATTLTELQRIQALFPGKRYTQFTISPIVTGTTFTAIDGSDQTPHANAGIVDSLNNSIRINFDYWDFRAAVELAPGSQKWRGGWTGDGIHPLPPAYRQAGAAMYGPASRLPLPN